MFYVWFDALIGYMSAVSGNGPVARRPAPDRQRDRALPRHLLARVPDGRRPAAARSSIYAHGWLLFENDKMSKSRGNIVRAEPIRQVMGFDALRYFLLREMVFGQDGSFSYDALIGRYNSELANGLGNLVSRTLTMINQYRGGVIPAGTMPQSAEIARNAIAMPAASFDEFRIFEGLEAIWALLSAVDKFIVEQAPWKLARAQDADAQAQAGRRALATVGRKCCGSHCACCSR